MKKPKLWNILKETVEEWSKDHVSSYGAALAFYSVLSIGPLLLIIIAIAGIAFGVEAANGHIVAEIRGLVGHEGAEAIQTVIANSRNKETGFWATAIGIVTLLIAATGVFGQLQDALNIIWKVKARPRGIWWSIQKRFLSFAMLTSIGFLLMVSLIISAGLAAFGTFFEDALPALFMEIMHFVISFGVITVLFALIFKILPDAHIRWRHVWAGAALSALLFTFGKSAIGFYLGHSALSSTFGAAGSLIVVLIWIYYSAQILLFGAEFTQVYARGCGARTIPTEDAVKAKPQA